MMDVILANNSMEATVLCNALGLEGDRGRPFLFCENHLRGFHPQTTIIHYYNSDNLRNEKFNAVQRAHFLGFKILVYDKIDCISLVKKIRLNSDYSLRVWPKGRVELYDHKMVGIYSIGT